jgi:AcrR family transcriptional regulator
MDQSTRTKRPQASAGERARTSILDAAEELFAREGPSAVTLRSIAAAGDVNIAAVNYYFGSKEKLFEEMFLRRIVPLNDERLERLQACVAAAGGKPTLESIVTAYVMPALQLTDAAGVSARAIVVQYSLGRVLAMPEVNQMLARYYAEVREAFVAALQHAAPHLAPHEVVWRYYWMGGSLMVALAVSPDAIEAPNGAVVPVGHGSYDTMPSHLIAFLVRGISACRGVADADPEGTATLRKQNI